eukprot:1732026-Pyramimonas_sp.AAC.2
MRELSSYLTPCECESTPCKRELSSYLTPCECESAPLFRYERHGEAYEGLGNCFRVLGLNNPLYERRGEAYEGLGNWQKARSDLDYALRLQPSSEILAQKFRGMEERRAVADIQRKMEESANTGYASVMARRWPEALMNYEAVLKHFDPNVQ